MSKNERIIESWLANADAWIDTIQYQLIKSRENVTNKAIVNEVQSLYPTRVLDMGCGEGWLCRKLADEGINTVGIDGSPPLIKEAKRLHDGEYYEMTYEEFTDQPKPFSYTFDVAVFNFSLLAKEIDSLLLSVKDVLSSKGHLVIQTLHPFNFGHPYVNHWKEENYEKMRAGYKKSMPWYFRTMSGWKNVLNDAGLTIVDLVEPINSETLKPESLILVCQKSESINN